MGPRFHTDPAALYREMRRDHGPVVPVLLPGDVPAWLVIGYREMYQVTGDPVLFPRDPGLWNQWPHIPQDWPLLPMIGNRQPSIYYTVGEEHQRHLKMVEGALERVSRMELRKHAEELADRLVDGFCAVGEAEVISAYAKPLPILVLGRLLGFPDSDGPALIRTLGALADGGADAIAAHQEFGALVGRLVAGRRERPGADVTSYMLACPAHFTDEEYLLDLMAITAAGYLPTADWIGNSVRLMLTDDRFAASLTGGRHSVHEAMNEVLWEDTPTQILAGRWAARDTRLADRHVNAGDLLLLGLAGANSDPETQTATAGSADGFRDGNYAHFAFSHGEFQCPFPAREIAETIARTGIEVLLDRLPDIDLAVPARALARRPSPFLRGMTGLPVHFTPIPAYGGRR
ncbi:cytochrome P450 [Streptomyces sp. OF3]|uniref:Cytochrome P450 n=2 Tax=Streptomyces alkaliterrae TaxID=2213162 RepID=A0A5P0YZT5_9ACTN|nr:cytochrome P450 [Streptomyces alkaliterrae]MBB1256824.1 cytochrome P450 [Streptomyces alkaliterrae]MBB1262357.1 cytochrome P450 [Streptomyces alkaliterrae]MQS04299.1 cytochrome P450 [Streptomyces alkaliterrae]